MKSISQASRDYMRSQKVFDVLLEQGFLIGSRAWGGAKANSDYDLIIDETIFEKIMLSCKKNGIVLDERKVWGFSANMDEHNMFNTLNLMFNFPDGQELNVIAYRTEDLPMIWNAHQAMMAMKDTVVGKMCAENKNHRIQMFQAAKEVAFEKLEKMRCKCIGFQHNDECYEHPAKVRERARANGEFHPDDDIPF